MKIDFVQPKLFEFEEEYVAYKLGAIILVSFQRPDPKVKKEEVAKEECQESTPGAPIESTNFDPSN